MDESILEDMFVLFVMAVLKTGAVPVEYEDLPEWVKRQAEDLVALQRRLEFGA